MYVCMYVFTYVNDMIQHVCMQKKKKKKKKKKQVLRAESP